MGPFGVAHVYLCLTEEAYKRFVKHEGKGLKPDRFLGDGAAASTHMINDAVSRKQLRSVAFNRAAAIVSHECAHATRFIQEIMREQGRFSEEAEAYCVQYLVQECMALALPETARKRK